MRFAYFKGWPLNISVNLTWERCIYEDPAEGHILGLPARERSARLRDALWRNRRRAGLPFACTYARAIGSGNGEHDHLGLFWGEDFKDLVDLVSRVTGVGPATRTRRPRGQPGYVAGSKGGGWLIQENIGRDKLQGALRWGEYQLRQEAEHPAGRDLDGKAIGVSRAIDARAMAPHREALEAWKERKGWQIEEAPSEGPLRAAEGQP